MAEQIAPMKKIFFQLAVLFAFTPLVFAHVGSPNVFFEGRAGAYSVYAVVRPPAALPGIAQVSVRVNEPDVRSVSLLPVLWQAGRQGSPQPVAAQRVPGETNLWSAEVWLLYPGSYSMQIGVVGANGSGEATIPVNAIATQGQPMKPALRTTLLLFAIFLFTGAVLTVGAISREGCVEPGAKFTRANWSRARLCSGIAILSLAAGVTAGAVRWRDMDFAYRNQWIQKPEPVSASTRVETNRVVLELKQAGQSLSLPPWSALVPDHGKLMHLFLVREPELNVFAHLHPFRVDARMFTLDLPALPSGDYQLYGDITFENGISQTLVARVKLPEAVGQTLLPPPLVTNVAGEVICGFPPALTNGAQFARDMDDSWHLDSAAKMMRSERGFVSRLMGGYTLLFENADDVIAGRETSLRFAAFAPDGSDAALQPYMGMPGHAAVQRTDGSVFAHIHPSGSFSMASQEVFRQRGGANVPAASQEKNLSNRVSFPFQFPKPGAYRLWIQVRIAGRVLTGVYDVQIKSGA